MASFKNSADFWISLRGSGLGKRFMVACYHQRLLFDIGPSEIKMIRSPTLCRPPGALTFLFRGFFGFLLVCTLIRLVDDFASFHNDLRTVFL